MLPWLRKMPRKPSLHHRLISRFGVAICVKW